MKPNVLTAFIEISAIGTVISVRGLCFGVGLDLQFSLALSQLY